MFFFPHSLQSRNEFSLPDMVKIMFFLAGQNCSICQEPFEAGRMFGRSGGRNMQVEGRAGSAPRPARCPSKETWLVDIVQYKTMISN